MTGPDSVFETAQALSGLEVSALGSGRSLRFHALVRSSSKTQGPLSATPRLCAVTITPRRLPAVEPQEQAKPSLLTTLVRRLADAILPLECTLCVSFSDPSDWSPLVPHALRSPSPTRLPGPRQLAFLRGPSTVERVTPLAAHVAWVDECHVSSRHEVLFQQSCEPMVLLDKRGVVREANTRMIDLFGYSQVGGGKSSKGSREERSCSDELAEKTPKCL